jgi:hypothetical protein
MTYLEICQRIAQESGVISGTQPTSVVGQNGKLKAIVGWGAEAYNMIQRERRDWRWLEGAFSGVTVAAQQRYTAANLGITTRFSSWVIKPTQERYSVSAYLTSAGRAEEYWLVWREWDDFNNTMMFGAPADDTGKPAYFSVDPDDKIVLWPTPDAVYTLRGRYRKAIQQLAANTDTPEMPEENHMAIVWQGVMLMGTYDEAVQMQPNWQAFYDSNMQNLRLKAMPVISSGGPLA